MLLLSFLTLYIVTCTAQETGDLRLVDGDAPYEGRLEIYINGSGWGTICYRGYRDIERFDLLEADAACRQLGYTRAAEVGTTEDLGVPSGRTSPLLSSVSCPMDAKHLYNNCTLSYYVTYYCNYGKVAISCRDIDSTPKLHDLRLVDSQGNTNVSAGRLEMYMDRSWVTFCSLNQRATHVACWWTARGGYHRYGTASELGYPPGSGSKKKARCYRQYQSYDSFEDCYIYSSTECSDQDVIALSCVACDRASFCDGSVDCDMCVDECHCSNYNYYYGYGRTAQVTCKDCVCNETEFKCEESGVCIDGDEVCDGRNLCSDASDENTPECLEKRLQASRDLDELGQLRAGIVVGVILVVVLLLLVAMLLCLALLRKRYSGKPQSPNETVPSDQDTTTTAITTTSQ